MQDIATAQISGDLTQDVDLRDLPSGAQVARLRVASTGRRRNGDEWADKTSYFTVDVYAGRPARARNTSPKPRAYSSRESSTISSGPTRTATGATRS
ncbi:MAG: single-stranded DNA-binding protein [Solirubrobacteraceae bacterium]|jgi:single-stranded DNA-binding protein